MPKSRAATRETFDEFDVLVPDPQVRREFGNTTEMTTHRWDRDPEMAALGWPPPVYIRNRKHRSRRLLEQFKRNLLTRAIKERSHGCAERATS